MPRSDTARPKRIGAVAVLATALASGASIATLGAGDLPDPSGDLPVAVSVGSFAALLTALTFAIAIIDGAAPRWPAVSRLTTTTGAVTWVVLSVAGVGYAILASTLVPELRLTSYLVAATLTAAGVFVLRAVLEAGEGPGREHFVANELRRAWSRAAGPTDHHSDAFVETLSVSANSRELARFHEGTNALAQASSTLGPSEAAAAMTTHLSVLAGVASSVFGGRLPIESASRALRQARTGVLALTFSLSRDPTRSGAQQHAALLLGYYGHDLARLSFRAMRHYDELCRAGRDVTHLEGLLTDAALARRAIREAVDPDPPGVYFAPTSPWARGLTDPEAMLLWYWGFVQHMGHKHGMAQFPLYEVLTGTKFLGSYSQGQPVLPAIEEQLVLGDGPALQATRASLCSLGSPAAASLHRHIGVVGEYRMACLELFACAIAGYRPEVWIVPSNDILDWDYSTARENVTMRLRLFSELDPFASGRKSAPTEALMTMLLSPRLGGAGLTAKTRRASGELGLRAGPLPTPADSPGAAVLAIALPLYRHHGTESLNRFLNSIGDDLCRAALGVCAVKLFPPTDGESDRATLWARLIAAGGPAVRHELGAALVLLTD